MYRHVSMCYHVVDNSINLQIIFKIGDFGHFGDRNSSQGPILVEFWNT